MMFRLGYCNSAINPFIYALFARDFRNAFKKIICKLFCKVSKFILGKEDSYNLFCNKMVLFKKVNIVWLCNLYMITKFKKTLWSCTSCTVIHTFKSYVHVLNFINMYICSRKWAEALYERSMMLFYVKRVKLFYRCQE